MTETNESSGWRIVVVSIAAGWVIGMLWWTGLMIAFGPSVAITNEGGQLVEKRNSVASLVVYAPLVAIPWAVVGLIVGGLNAHFRGYWIAAIAIIGTLTGFAYSVATSPFDGWLAITMPIACLVGALAALLIGTPIRYVVGVIRKWEGA